MSGYVHLGREERDEIATLRPKGLGVRAVSRELSRSAPTISRELRRNACDGGSYRPHVADGGCMVRRQRPARLEREARLAGYVTGRLTEGSLSLIALQSSAGQRDTGADRGAPEAGH